MHVGEQPYILTPSGPLTLTSRPLTVDAMMKFVRDLLPAEALANFTSSGSVESDVPVPAAPGESFVLVAARGADDVWIEVRRRRSELDLRIARPRIPTSSPRYAPASRGSGTPAPAGTPPVPRTPTAAPGTTTQAPATGSTWRAATPTSRIAPPAGSAPTPTARPVTPTSTAATPTSRFAPPAPSAPSQTPRTAIPGSPAEPRLAPAVPPAATPTSRIAPAAIGRLRRRAR